MPAELTSVKVWAVEQIRSLINSGELEPEQKVLIETLSQRLGVSRTPVREALWQLAGEGLVTVIPRVGAFVRRISARETEDIFRIKVAVEPMMAAWAAERAPRAARQAYRSQVAALTEAADAGDVSRYVEMLEECRRALVELAGSPPMSDVLGVIDGRVRLLRFRNLSQPGRLQLSVRHHSAVARAIAAGDGARAEREMRRHMESSAQAIRILLQAAAAADRHPTVAEADDEEAV